MLLIGALGVAADGGAQGMPSLTATRSLLNAGAAQLALDDIARQQPRESATPGWADWESLRCAALASLKRWAELLERAPTWPRGAASMATCDAVAAQAALAMQSYVAARRYAARALWQPQAVDVPLLRRLVIDAYLGERRADQAFGAMLRMQHDYTPLTRELAAHFAAGLLNAGQHRDALTWLPYLDDGQPVKLALRLRAGLATGESARAALRTGFRAEASAAHWSSLLDTVMSMGDDVLAVAVRELWVNSGRAAPDVARGLWDAYIRAADNGANRERLLIGDDASWADFAGRRLGTDPALARSFFAHLAQDARTASSRYNGQLQLLHALREDKLDVVAVRVFQAAFPDVALLDTQVRYRLGEMAEAAGEAQFAYSLWRDLPAPGGMDATAWLARVERQRWQSTRTVDGVAALAGAYAQPGSQARPAIDAVLRYVDDLEESGENAAAAMLLQPVIAVADAPAARRLSERLAKMQMAAGQHREAALAFLRSVDGLHAAEPAVADARLRAGRALLKAGYKEDAKAQFEWAAANAKDPAIARAARAYLDLR